MKRTSQRPASYQRLMRQRLAAAAAAVILILAFGAACASRLPLPEGSELIPADATFAISVDIKAIQNSAVYKRYQAEERAFGLNRLNFYRFAEAAGLDPSKEIDRVMFMARAGEEGLEEMSGLALGKFDGRKVHDFLVQSGLPSRRVAGMDIFEFIVIEDRCRFCVSVVDSSTAAFGDGETLGAIARIKAGESQGISSETRVSRLLRRIGSDPEAWGIVRADDLKGALAGMLRNTSGDASGLRGLGPIREASFSFNSEEPMRVVLEMTASTDQDAMLLADVLKGVESMGRLALREAKPEMSLLMSDLVIVADTGLVRVAGSIPSSDVDSVARLLGATWLTGGLSPSTAAGAQPSP